MFPILSTHSAAYPVPLAADPATPTCSCSSVMDSVLHAVCPAVLVDHVSPVTWPPHTVAYPALSADYPGHQADYPAHPAACPAHPVAYPAQPAAFTAHPAAYFKCDTSHNP